MVMKMQNSRQTDNHNFKKYVEIDESYILRKIGSKFWTAAPLPLRKLFFFCKTALFFFYKMWTFWGPKINETIKQKWLNKVICFNDLKNRNYTKNESEK